MRFHQKTALAGQMGLFVPKSDWTAPTELPDLSGARRLCVDIETRDPDLKAKGPGFRRDAYIVGLGVAIEDGPKFYFPVRHEGGGNLNEKMVKRWAADELNRFSGEVVGANLGYDLDGLATWGVTFPAVKAFHDVLVAEPLLDENKVGEYNLDAVSKEHLGEGKEEDLLLEAGKAYGFTTSDQIKSNLWRFPASLVGPYAEGDVDRPLRILPVQMAKLGAEDLLPVYEIERKLIPILVRMRQRGVPINVPKVEALRVKLVALRERWITELKRLAGPKAELMEPDSFVKAIQDRGIDVPLTKKTNKRSITKPMLERHQADPLVRTILNGRKVNTLINTFVDGQLLGHLIKGRVHPIFNQLKGDDAGTVGRLSCSHPNAQFIPARDADWQEENLAPLVREVFEPEAGEQWQRDDYSQIEYRFLVDCAVGRGAEEARERYRTEPTTSFHVLCADFLKADVSNKNVYRKIKVTNFCKVYGGGTDKVALTFGCPKAEAQEFIDTYDAELPFVRETYEAASRWASRRGYVVTVLNRRQRFPDWGPSWYRKERPSRLFKTREEAAAHYIAGKVPYNDKPVRSVERVDTYTALCRKLQVSAADLMKKAMVDADEAGLTAPSALGPFLITVHDELGSSVPPTPAGDEAGKELTRIMAGAIKIKVPILVESDRAGCWGDCS